MAWLELWWRWLLRLGGIAPAASGRWWQRDTGSAEWVPPQKTLPVGNTDGLRASFPGENWGVCVPGPRREQIIRLQGQVDKHYAGLKEAAEERRRRLENMSHLFQLKREVEDLEQWIAERDVVASSQEMGQDLDHVTVRGPGRACRCRRMVLGGGHKLDSSFPPVQLLREKFREFARETGSVGQERVDRVNLAIEDLIDAGHAEAATMAEWKDGLNESWADLLELIDTRMQLLAASHDLHKYFYDGAELLALIATRRQELPQDLGEDAGTVEAFHRMHSAFERDLQLLETQVRWYPGAGGDARCCWHSTSPNVLHAGPAVSGDGGSPADRLRRGEGGRHPGAGAGGGTGAAGAAGGVQRAPGSAGGHGRQAPLLRHGAGPALLDGEHRPADRDAGETQVWPRWAGTRCHSPGAGTDTAVSLGTSPRWSCS